MTALPVGPYAQTAHTYLAAGWCGVLPVGRRPRLKKDPPKGYTGRDGAWPTIEEIDGWCQKLGFTNIALRLPAGVIGIDIDQYDGKVGADTAKAVADRHGPPPPTWTSSSRERPSGIRLYRVPEGETLDGVLVHPDRPDQKDVEVIQHHHRYMVVWPSIHPEGREYSWTGPDGQPSGIPSPDQLPELPAAWREHLHKRCSCFALTIFKASTGDTVADRVAEVLAALGGGSRHDSLLEPVLALAGFRNRGSRQAAEALDMLGGEFITAVTAPGHKNVRTRAEAEGEWRRMTTEGKAATAGAGMPPWEDAQRPDPPPAPKPPEPQPLPGVEPAEELAAAVTTFKKWLHLPDPGALYVVLATVAANRAEGDPVWALLVGPPGGGKTELLGPLARLHDVHPAATLTEASLLSGTPGKDRAKDSRGGLLREIGDFGILVLKDFGSILSMNRDARAAVLAALREIYDGAWTRHVGTDGGRTLTWSGKVGLVAGCTPAIDSHHAVVGSMGERFVLYRLPKVEAEAQVRRAMRHVGRESRMREELGEVVAQVLATVRVSQLTAEPGAATVEKLVSISTLAVRCRSAVERDAYNREITLIPESEAPARLALVLLRLHNALLAIGVDDTTTWELVRKCALDSMPAIRRAVLEHLVGVDGPISTAKVAESLDYPTTTTKRALEDLTAHGIVHRESQGPGKADLWTLTQWTLDQWPKTSPEKSGRMGEAAEDGADTSPEKSEGTGEEDGDDVPAGGDAAPLPIPTRVPTNFSGEVPPPARETDDLHSQIWGASSDVPNPAVVAPVEDLIDIARDTFADDMLVTPPDRWAS